MLSSVARQAEQDVEFGFFCPPGRKNFCAPRKNNLCPPDKKNFCSSDAENVRTLQVTPAPGVILIPDVHGLSDLYRELAQRLCAEGFAVLAIDLYRHGEKPSLPNVEAALSWIRKLSDPVLLADLQAAADWLSVQPEVAGRRLGVMGFCMGGQYALLAAARLRGFSACASFYGTLRYEPGLDPAKKPASPLMLAREICCPVLGLYGEQDALIPVEDVQALEQELKRIDSPTEIVLYAGAGHAFMNDRRESAYRPVVAQDAWRRLCAFFHKHLDA